MRLVAVCLLLTMLMTACSRPRPGGPKGHCSDVRALINPAGRVAAMLSVHAAAFDLREHVETLALSRAATLLSCDRAAGSFSRRRRAAAELAAYGRLHDFAEPIATLGFDLATIRAEIQQRYPYTLRHLLRNPDVLEMVTSNLIAERDEARDHAPPPPPPPPADPPAHGPPVQLTDANPAAFEVRKCNDWIQEQPWVVSQNGPTVTVDGAISVDLEAATVDRNVDPQRWDECSHFWSPPPNATRLVRQLAGNAFQELTPPPPIPNPGTDYHGTLFEHFSCNTTGCSTWFKNLLSVTTAHADAAFTPPPDIHFYASYGLANGGFIAGCVLGAPDTCQGGTRVTVQIDHGWIEVWRERNRTMVHSHKDVKFDNAVGTGISQALLTFAELDRELAEVACCFKALGEEAPQ